MTTNDAVGPVPLQWMRQFEQNAGLDAPARVLDAVADRVAPGRPALVDPTIRRATAVRAHRGRSDERRHTMPSHRIDHSARPRDVRASPLCGSRRSDSFVIPGAYPATTDARPSYEVGAKRETVRA